MSAWRRLSALAAAVLGCVAWPAAARAQGSIPDSPQVSEIIPASAERGATVEVTLNGQHLSGARGLLCRYSPFPKLIAPTERGIKAEVLSSNDGQIRARLQVARDAPPGLHEIRALGAEGITPPQYFYVSQFPEVQEKEPNNTPEQANPVTLPVTIAGTIQENEDQDVYSFAGKRGERLVFDLDGFKRFSPPQNQQQGLTYLDALLTLRDSSGRELAYNDDTNGLDPLLTYVIPQDGTYFVTVRDNQYRGRGDFHYRLTIGKQPYVTAVFPPGGQRGTRLTCQVFGYNLDSSGATSVRRALELPETGGVTEFRITTDDGISNALPVVAGVMPEVSETEPNDTVQDATQVIVPVICSGTFDRIGDVDAYRFQAQAGQRLLVETLAARLGSPVDTAISVTDRTGKVIGRDDDGAGQSDSRLEVTIPTTDEYVVWVRNEAKGAYGPQCFYRLTIRPVQPWYDVSLRQDGINGQGQPAKIPVDGITVPQGAASTSRCRSTGTRGRAATWRSR